MNQPHHDSRTALAIVVGLLAILGMTTLARAQSGAGLMNRVNAALHSNDRLNGARSYTASEGVVVLYGTVFDDKDRALAEQVARGVPGVNDVIDNLQTKTGKWYQEEVKINSQLQMSGFNDVQAKVIGPYIYLSGQVTGQGNKDRAGQVASSVFPDKQISNMIFVQPGSVF
jgi:osmotically-inducible protein OsmY